MNKEKKCSTCANVIAKEIFTGGSHYRCAIIMARVNAKFVCDKWEQKMKTTQNN